MGALPAAAQTADARSSWPPASLDGCEQLLAREPASVRSYLCFSAVVRAGRATRAVALGRISALATRRSPSPHALYVHALMLADQSDPAAEAAYGKAIAAYDGASDPRGQVRARVYLATYRSILGFDRASEPLDAAARIAAASGDPELVALVTVEQAWVAYRTADYGRATRLLERVESTVRGRVAADVQTKWLSCRGAVLWALGDSDRALATYQQELALVRREGNVYDEATVLNNLALLSRGAERAAYARQGVSLARRLGNAPGEVSAVMMLASSLPDRDALRELRRGLDVAARVDDREGTSQLLRTIANRLLPTDPAAALSAVEQAIAVSRTSGDPNELVRNLVIRSMLRWEIGPRAQALSESLEVLDEVEALRNRHPEPRVRAQRFGQWRVPYYSTAGHLLAGHLLGPGAAPSPRDRDDAFRVAERLRARLLLDRLDASRAEVPVTVDAALRQQHRAVLDRISQANRELMRPGLSADVRRQLLASLEGAERDEAEVRGTLVKASPAFAMMRAPTLATITDVQQALAADEALVAFQVHDTEAGAQASYGAWRWVISRDRVEVEPIARPGELSAAVRIFLGLVTSGDAKAARVSARLHALIFGDALDRLPARVRRLVIVPDDALVMVPFDALRAGVDAPPLAQRFAIALAPSATTWWRLRRLGQPGALHGALIYADPSGASPWASWSGGRTTTREDGTLVPLPGSRREGRSAVRALSGSSRVVTGSDASETAFKRDGFGTYRILHFAAHAMLDTARPERTAVLLAPSETDDGMLQVREIVDLPLSGQAVILSACQSANGVLVPAEGLFGLTHAFVLAGARVVVANLWPVRDTDAADFMGLVYRRIRAGPRRARRRAARARRVDGTRKTDVGLGGDGGHGRR